MNVTTASSSSASIRSGSVVSKECRDTASPLPSVESTTTSSTTNSNIKRMTNHPKTVQFNVGGRIYEVSRSLLELYPHTMLARSASTIWCHTATTAPTIFIDRNGERFAYILDYMRDGIIELPYTISKDAILIDLEYYGFTLNQNDNDSTLQDCIHHHDSAIPMATACDQMASCIQQYKAKMMDFEERAQQLEQERICTQIAYRYFKYYITTGNMIIQYTCPNTTAANSKNAFKKSMECKMIENHKTLLNTCLQEYGLMVRSILYDKNQITLASLRRPTKAKMTKSLSLTTAISATSAVSPAMVGTPTAVSSRATSAPSSVVSTASTKKREKTQPIAV